MLLNQDVILAEEKPESLAGRLGGMNIRDEALIQPVDGMRAHRPAAERRTDPPVCPDLTVMKVADAIADHVFMRSLPIVFKDGKTGGDLLHSGDRGCGFAAFLGLMDLYERTGREDYLNFLRLAADVMLPIKPESFQDPLGPLGLEDGAQSVRVYGRSQVPRCRRHNCR